MGKIGVGVYGFSQEVLDALVKMQASPILLCNPPTWFYTEVRRRLPGAFVVLRLWRDGSNQPLTQLGAGEFAYEVLTYAKELRDADPRTNLPYNRRGPDAIMGYNETPKDQVWEYDNWQVDFAATVQARAGFPVCGHNFGVGCPQVADVFSPYDPFRDQIVSMASTQWVKYIGMHLYGAPNEAMDGPNRDWYALRYRKSMRAWAQAFKTPMPKIIATESGYNQPPMGSIPTSELMRQIVWLQEQLDADGQIGQCVFGLFGNGKWPGFDLMGTDMIDRIAAYNSAH